MEPYKTSMRRRNVTISVREREKGPKISVGGRISNVRLLHPRLYKRTEKCSNQVFAVSKKVDFHASEFSSRHSFEHPFYESNHEFPLDAFDVLVTFYSRF